jgi:tyrosine-protein kinase Etk/Wzc
MNKPVQILEAGNDTDDIYQPLILLWARKKLIIAITALFILGGIVAANLMKPVYRADALVQLEPRNGGMALSSDIAEIFATESEAITEIEIIKSRMVLGRVIEELNLDVIAEPVRLPVVGDFLLRHDIPRPDWGFLRGYAWHEEKIQLDQLNVPEAWLGKEIMVQANGGGFDVTLPDERVVAGQVGQLLDVPEANFSMLVSELVGAEGSNFEVRRTTPLAAVGRIRKGLSVSEKSRKTGILQVSMLSPSRQNSQQIVDRIVQAYVGQNIGRSAEEAERSLEFMQAQLPKIQEQLSSAESELNAYRLENKSVNLDLEAQSVLQRIVSLDAQISELSLEETELSRLYTRNHPRYNALLEKKGRLSDEKNKLSSTIESMPATQQEVLRLTRDVEVTQQIYVQLLNKSQELNVLKAGAVGNVRIIDEAAAPPSPVKPKKPMIIALAAMLGAIMAGAFVLLRTSLSSTIDGPEELKKLGIPVYSVVPHSEFQTKLNRPVGPEQGLLSRENPAELAVEAVRSLRTSLHFGLLDGEKKVVCVTGPSPAVGKSFICANLAYLAATSGSRVLLVDADLRRGTIGRHFGISKELPGLSNILSGRLHMDDAMYAVDVTESPTAKRRKAVEPEPQDQKKEPVFAENNEPEMSTAGFDETLDFQVFSESDLPDADLPRKSTLTVVPRGYAPPNPSELLMHPRFNEFVDSVAERFDMVIIDTPPVLAATDSIIVGKYAGMNLMVLRHNLTTSNEAEEAVQMFTQNDLRITGVVLNGYDRRHGKYGAYGTQYGYRYAYY